MKLIRLTQLAALALALAVSAQAQTVTNLANFNGRGNGNGPFGAIVQATDGNFYGATAGGGTYDSGNVFRMTPGGQLKSIYSFCPQSDCADGSVPSGPVLGSDGNLYGVTSFGGSKAGYELGSGVIYKMTLAGQITTLYTFCSVTPCADGQFPTGMVLGYDGNFYGTTNDGGNSDSGTFFQISPSGKFKVVYSFCAQSGCADGSHPVFPPIQGIDGNFYGIAQSGGALGPGAAYRLTPSGIIKVLHSFCYGDGCMGDQPSQIVQDAKGNLFGTTVMGGSSATHGKIGYGTVFEITSTGEYVVLDNFDFVRGTPRAGFALANDGNLYGTSDGGRNGGTLFEVTPAGRYTQLYTFDVCGVTGYNPSVWLIQGTDGLFYGSTIYGGGTSCGTTGSIYSVSTGLTPLVETVPTGGKVGKSVLILGNNLTGTTSVTFNGVAAEFTVASDTYIKATVPNGATTGTVSVVTPSGMLNSNPQFVVTH